jgi:Outer membrane protein beta-barrel domain
MQYHLNSKVYLQTELQVANPQFIQPVLMYQTKTDIPGTNSIQYNSVYARKLYYFNIPVGIHYAPFQHFYLGTGLQFSSFISGVALEEKTSTVVGSGTNTLISEKYTKFKDDSLSGKIDNSEFRLMLDANYYWKQFTVGLRYNQALTNYVSFRLDPASPIFADKNKSLQFYLRYNFWERPKKK